MARVDLERLPAELIASGAFGFHASGGAASIALDPSRLAHIQLGDKLYRLIISRHAVLSPAPL